MSQGSLFPRADVDPGDPMMRRGARFGGPGVTSEDAVRLSGQLGRVREALTPGEWWSLERLARHVGGSEAGVSARLRDLRKPEFGGHTVERKRVTGGLWLYRMVDGGAA